MAVQWNLRLPSTNNFPVTEKDMQKALAALIRSPDESLDAETKVYMVCHHFHQERKWLAEVIDNWFAEEGICIVEKQKDAEGNNKPGIVIRNHPTDQGGFSAVARDAKSYALRNLMRYMLRHAKWCIATTFKETLAKNTAGKGQKKYDKIEIYVPLTQDKYTCYVVTTVAAKVCCSAP